MKTQPRRLTYPRPYDPFITSQETVIGSCTGPSNLLANSVNKYT